MSVFRHYAAFPAVIIPLALALFCGKGSNNPAAAQENGTLEIRARVVNRALAKSAAAAETAADTLVVVISAGDMDTVRIKRKLDLSRPSLSDTVGGIPPGNNRKVTISAIGKNGKVTHIDSTESHTVAIVKTVAASVYSTLIPAAGSIYLQFAGLPTSVDAVHAAFTADGGALVAQNTVKRAAKTFMSLDNIPHMTAGNLRVAIIATNGDTTHIANTELTFNARSDNTVNLEFRPNSGMLGLDVAVYAPGVTVGSYDFGNTEPAAETGELIITEIMWSASNDNYIELYNPADTPCFFETLTTDVDGTTHNFSDVTVASKGYFVIGRQNLPYFNAHTSAVGGLPVTSTGNWITVKREANGAVLDRVIFAGTGNAIGWPSMPSSAKRSIELAKDKYSATDNNFGKNWSAAAEFISEESTGYGTPGR